MPVLALAFIRKIVVLGVLNILCMWVMVVVARGLWLQDGVGLLPVVVSVVTTWGRMFEVPLEVKPMIGF